MHIDELLQPSVGANYAHYEITWPSRRCRFIAHTADLSALLGNVMVPHLKDYLH